MNTFGISAENFPIKEDGILSLDEFENFIQKRRLEEGDALHVDGTSDCDFSQRKSSECDHIAVTEQDILLGRGRPSQVGNHSSSSCNFGALHEWLQLLLAVLTIFVASSHLTQTPRPTLGPSWQS